MRFVVSGPPRAKQRPRRSPDGHWYTPRPTKDYELLVAQEAMVAGVKLEPKKEYALEITFYLSTRRSDLDNLEKSILDGLQRLGGWNDRQVVSLVGRVVSVKDGSEEMAVVEVRER